MSLFVDRVKKKTYFKKEVIWTTSAGKEINIKDMDNDHLCNTVKMLKRGKDAQGRCVKNKRHFLSDLEIELMKRGVIIL